MAELHRVEINEKAPSEIEPEKEQQVDETVETPQDQAIEETQERPEWLPEKFKSAEDMANAYAELEKRMGAGAKEDTEEQPQEQQEDNDDQPEEAPNYNQAVVDASQEFFANDGQLSEETYKKLEEVGLPKDLVDSYAAGQQALMQSEEAQIQGVANGQYDEMAEWANDNLPQEEIDAFDEAVVNGTVQQAKLAVQGLYARYQNATGSTPKLTQGNVVGSATMPFKSMQELARAQSDPRYRSGDKAYHEEVDRRLAVSNI
jgi:hypothetical protein